MKSVGCLAMLTLMFFATTASGNLLVNGDFSQALSTGWTVWNDDTRSPATIGIVSGQLQITGDHINGGVYQVVSVPAGQPLTLNGEWEGWGYQTWAELMVFEGAHDYNSLKAVAGGPDLNPDGGNPDGNINDGELIYKNDAWPGPGSWGYGNMASISVKGSGGNPVPGSSASGTITIVLKHGSWQGTGTYCNVDNLVLTPEPTAALLLAVPMILLRRRRA